jgi:hypothetical protein
MSSLLSFQNSKRQRFQLDLVVFADLLVVAPHVLVYWYSVEFSTTFGALVAAEGDTFGALFLVAEQVGTCADNLCYPTSTVILLVVTPAVAYICLILRLTRL